MFKMRHDGLLFCAAIFFCYISQQIFVNSLDPISSGLLISGAVASWFGYNYQLHCKFYECCDDSSIKADTQELKNLLRDKLYGQHIAENLIYTSIHSHVQHKNPKKPLALSFHGLPGSGKNYVVTMIANSLFVHGEKSRHYHFYNGRTEFPREDLVYKYKEKITQEIQNALASCEKSVFVFDEVDKIPEGILDAIVPFIDYTSKFPKSIFIFLSNTGGSEVVDKLLDHWRKGLRREDISLKDFETLIAIGAFNEKGGFYKSDTIQSKLIDHHVPFLPMEKEHVELCILDAFNHWGFNPKPDHIKQVLSHITYGPKPYNLYSLSGCKRLDHKVSSVVYKEEYKEKSNSKKKS